MGWPEVIADLEAKLIGTLQGTYRPLDNVPFFRVQYPPQQEREALREFALLAERLRQRGWQAEMISLTEVLAQALGRLLNSPWEDLPRRLRDLEEQDKRSILLERLADHLPEVLTMVLRERLAEWPRQSVALLVRMGALYPFLRSSVLEARLENYVRCTVVLSYPGTTLGALLDAQPGTPHGMYYRGEIIRWR